MAAAGHAFTGVDPARASLDAARSKPRAAQVQWIEGTSTVLSPQSFDVAVMTSHVAQVFVADDERQQTLADLHRTLVPGARLVFDTRDPRARAWERWNPADSHRRVRLPTGRDVEIWNETTAVTRGTVSFTRHYRFSDDEELVSSAILRFRTEEDTRASLRMAGFRVEAIYGGWDREPVGDGDGELLVVARA